MPFLVLTYGFEIKINLIIKNLILIMASLSLKIKYIKFFNFFLMLNLFTMMVYVHSLDLIVLMFPCIESLSIE